MTFRKHVIVPKSKFQGESGDTYNFSRFNNSQFDIYFSTLAFRLLIYFYPDDILFLIHLNHSNHMSLNRQSKAAYLHYRLNRKVCLSHLFFSRTQRNKYFLHHHDREANILWVLLWSWHWQERTDRKITSWLFLKKQVVSKDHLLL